MEPWLDDLEAGRSEAAWSAFLVRYRALLFASIRHYVRDHDDVMDVFTWVCEALRKDDLRRLRHYTEGHGNRARFSTWLVTVVRRLAVDWLRMRDGRRRPRVDERLSPLQQRIHEAVFVKRLGHVAAFEAIRSRDDPELSFGHFLRELAMVYRTARAGAGGARREREDEKAREPSVDSRAVEHVVETETRQVLGKILEGLTPIDRVAVEMYVIDELPAAEVARTLGMSSPKAAYNRIYRTLAALRAALQEAGLEREDL